MFLVIVIGDSITVEVKEVINIIENAIKFYSPFMPKCDHTN